MSEKWLPSRVLIEAPTDEVISRDDCKAALGITTTSQDAMIDAAIAAAVSSLDAATGWLGRALRPQTWELRLSEFPHCREIRLPFPVLQSVTSIKYDDANGTEQTLVEDVDYRVFGVGDHLFGSVHPAYSMTWPGARCDKESVRIRYVCGYDAEVESPFVADKMPPAITHGIVVMVRLLLSDVERNMFLSQDTVVGVGSKTWVVSPSAQEVLKRASDALLYQFEGLSV